MDIKVTRTTSATFYGLIKLADLRKFMAAVEGCKDTASVQVSVYRGDPREGTSTTITVNDI